MFLYICYCSDDDEKFVIDSGIDNKWNGTIKWSCTDKNNIPATASAEIEIS